MKNVYLIFWCSRYYLFSMVFSIFSFNAFSQSCNCPPANQCAPCSGGIVTLTFQFKGAQSANIKVEDNKQKIFENTLKPGDTFTVNGSKSNGKFAGNVVELYVNNTLNTTIDVNCDIVLHPNTPYGSFIIVSGESKGGGALCCSAGSVDNIAPELKDCPANIDVTVGASQCSKTVTWTPPQAIDCNLKSLSSNTSPGNAFPVGTTTVTYTALDFANNSSTCTFNIIVRDITAPVFNGCPKDITVNANQSCQGKVSWTAPSATDNCTVQSLTSTHKSGDSFPFGTTEVIYTATDKSGNQSTCKFKVIVKDQSAPTFAGCPKDIVINATKCETNVTWTPPQVADNCTFTVTSTHQPGDSFPIGTTEVVYSAADNAGNKATCKFKVQVQDKTAPVFTSCPTDVILTANASCEGVATWRLPSTTDNCAVTLVASHNLDYKFKIGITEVVYTATDAAGNKSFCKFKVTVKDESGPAFTGCPVDITIKLDKGCNTKVNWIEPVAVDNCGTSTMTSTHKPMDTFEAGIHEVVYTAVDKLGNSSTCSFKVKVEAPAPPQLTACPANIEVKVTESDRSIVNWQPPTAVSTCGVVELTSTHNPGETFDLGTTTVTYTATDQFGKSTTCSFTIIVRYDDIDIDIAQVITPDGNGINDRWEIKNIEKYKNNKVTIIDRWGSVVYQTSSYNNINTVWDGETRNGSSAPTGTYFYTISVQLGPTVLEKKGFIELVR